MAPMTTTDEALFLATAQDLLASRLDVVRPLAQLIAERKRIQSLLDGVEKQYGVAYVAAEAGGWSAGELAQMGATEPTRRPAGRPKKSRTIVKTSSANATPPNPRSPEPSQTPEPAPSA